MLQPERDCPLCQRLQEMRAQNRARWPDWFNAPVPAFGGTEARLLIVGLAPGLRGANRTGRPFTGDAAGDVLYDALRRFGLAEGEYRREGGDGLRLIGCRISNAVRCVPPANRPTPAEVRACNAFLRAEIRGLPELRACLALGTVAHQAVLDALGVSRSRHRFAHGAQHRPAPPLVLADSYHCSRQNTNTGRLTIAMFDAVLQALLPLLRD